MARNNELIIETMSEFISEIRHKITVLAEAEASSHALRALVEAMTIAEGVIQGLEEPANSCNQDYRAVRNSPLSTQLVIRDTGEPGESFIAEQEDGRMGFHIELPNFPRMEAP